jgi:hypothetical protein
LAAHDADSRGFSQIGSARIRVIRVIGGLLLPSGARVDPTYGNPASQE